MNVEFSKAFVKASKRLSGKMLDSLRRTIVEVKAAKGIQDISDCKKLVGVAVPQSGHKKCANPKRVLHDINQ